MWHSTTVHEPQTSCTHACVCEKLQLWTAQPPLADWIRRGQPAHTPPQRPPGAEMGVCACEVQRRCMHTCWLYAGSGDLQLCCQIRSPLPCIRCRWTAASCTAMSASVAANMLIESGWLRTDERRWHTHRMMMLTAAACSWRLNTRLPSAYQ
eukprot:365087-Chlamydomonas_euryale.AAC.7